MPPTQTFRQLSHAHQNTSAIYPAYSSISPSALNTRARLRNSQAKHKPHRTTSDKALVLLQIEVCFPLVYRLHRSIEGFLLAYAGSVASRRQLVTRANHVYILISMNKTTLIILGGFSGAGKTTVAKRLSQSYNLPLICTDEVNDSLRAVFGYDFKTASPFAHELCWMMLRSYLNNDTTVILDTNMCNDRTWQNLDALSAELPDVTIVPMILQCTLETHKARIEERGRTNHEHLNLGGEVLEDILHKYEYIENLKRSDLIRISSDASQDEVYKNVVEYIQEINTVPRCTSVT